LELLKEDQDSNRA